MVLSLSAFCVCNDDYRYICISFQVHIQQWIDFASFEIDSNILAFYGPKIGRAVYLPLTEEAATSLLKRELGAVNTRLASNTFMVGHSVLLADIATPCKPLDELNKEAKKGGACEAQARSKRRRLQSPNLRILSDLLPPSKMILDGWKRLYSNTKTNFREVGGFLQRMDLARKYAFGKMLVIGSEPPFKAKGLWLFHGQEIPQFVLDECYDMELYEWKKVDIKDEE
ncbi:hypothetical protein ACB094_01G363600 [Castanea mollissima]